MSSDRRNEREGGLAFRNANLEDMLENISIPEFTPEKEDGSTVKASELTADEAYPGVSGRGERTDGAYLK